MSETSFAPSFTPFPYASATLAWNDDAVQVLGIDDLDSFRIEGTVRNLVPNVSANDQYFALDALRSIHVCQPWPAIEITWGDDRLLRRMLVHPRGVSRLVPANDSAREEFERFERLVESFVTHVERRARSGVWIDRGWLDDDIVTWTRRGAIPGGRGRDASYRDAAAVDALVARAVVQRSLTARARLALRRRLGDRRDPLPIELALSEREVWIVDDVGSVWGVPRASLRAIYTDDERLACIFGRCTFLAMSIAPSPIRDAFLEVARRAVAQNEALRHAPLI